jgi:3-oxoacyl-[acyl-carrier protein] reductase
MSSRQRVALVTGAVGGLGRAIGERLVADGHLVLVADIQSEAIHAVAEEISATPLVLDVSDEASVERVFADIESRFGTLDILVNNAGIGGARAPVAEMELPVWEKVIDVNLTGIFLMCKAAIPLMRGKGWGRIVNMSSLTARGQPGVNRCHYTASKAGIVGLSRMLADELGPEGITVNCVAPSRILTPLTLAAGANDPGYFDRGIAMTAIGRLGLPEDIANAVSWLCSDRAAAITGDTIDVNGGTCMI